VRSVDSRSLESTTRSLAAEAGGPAPHPDPLERYTLHRVIGSGGGGTVYAAHDHRLMRPVAIKMLHGSSVRTASAQGRVIEEARVMAQVSHPNVVPVYDAGVAAGQVFVVMEYVEGCDLKTWLRSPRSFREVLSVVLDAGRGLDAVHRAGLVHGDFKLENVLVSRDGRVLVTDFGLARAADLDANHGSSSDGAAQPPTTGEHRIPGTTGYIAPEQYRGLPCDQRSDQFSFAVVAYRALFSARPFGDDASQLRRTLVGELSLPPALGPARVRRAIVRALAPAPAARHASMTAMLQAMQGVPRTGRWVAAGILAAGLAGAILARSGTGDPCSDLGSRLAGVWDARVRAGVAAALRRSGSRGARDWRAVQAALDRYSQRWLEDRRAACRATHVEAAQSPALLDRRIACFDNRLLHLRAVTGVLREADRDTGNGALEAVSQLPAIETCSDLRMLQGSMPLPTSPAQSRQIAALQQRLARAKALQDLGKVTPADALAEAIDREAAQVAFLPLRAEARYVRAESHCSLARNQPCDAALRDAIWAAEATGYDELAARALIKAMYVAGYRLRQFDRAAEYQARADAILRRLGEPGALRASWLRHSGILALLRGEHRRAQEHFTRALAMERRLVGKRHRRAVLARFSLAALYERTGQHQAAETEYLATLGLANSDPTATIFTGALWNNLGQVALQRGDLPRAQERFRRATEILRGALGPTHPHLGMPMTGHATALLRAGRVREARTLLERAVVQWQHSSSAEPEQVSRSLQQLAGALCAGGEFAAADRRLRAARELLDRHTQDGDPLWGPFHLAAGDCLLARGRHRDAIRELEAAIAVLVGQPDQKLELARARAALARARAAATRGPRRRTGALLAHPTGTPGR
jgi:tetratricopeptide (TPR) repeat protein/predicted Ser/Thr protein kinase